MDKLTQIFKKLSKTQKNAILFDRVNNFTINALTEKILSYPSHIIDEFILTSDADYLVKFICEVRNSKKPLKSIKSKTDAFRVFVPKKNNQNDLEERKGQNDMIQDIKYAVENGKIIISEAPPGTGKSLAYLLPCIGEIKNGKRTVISTNTKNLQMQIFNNDAAIASDISNISFSACVLKGIGNYLCLQKYYDNKNFIEPLMVLALEGFIAMYESGDLAEMKFFYKTDMKDITSDSEYCMNKDCPYSSKCFFLKLRNIAKTSEIIFTNHYLSLIDASMSNKFFGEYQITVFDEAHNLENVVTDLFAYEYNFKYVMRMLYYFQKRINKVIRNITMKKEDGELKDSFNKIIVIINELINNNEILLFSIKDKITFENGRRKKYNTSLLSDYSEEIKEMAIQYYRLMKNSKEAMEIIKERFASKKQYFHLARYINEKTQSFYDAFIVTTDAGNEEYAFYYETNRNENIILVGVPIETGEIFSNLILKGEDKSIVFSSATLSVNKEFELFKTQTGIKLSNRDFMSGIYETSFKWNEQMKIVCISDMGNPNEKEFLDRTALLIEMLCDDGKKTIVLTTSYEQIDYLANHLKHDNYIFHKKGDNPELILAKHKSSKKGVLIGTNRYWEGVDLPGELLERVIILKMPFAVPDDPIIEKRCEKRQEMGINPFMEYTLPLAILKLKQGIGRLIRKRSDTGEVYILDERIIKKRYGKIITKSLFVEPKVISYNRIMKGKK